MMESKFLTDQELMNTFYDSKGSHCSLRHNVDSIDICYSKNSESAAIESIARDDIVGLTVEQDGGSEEMYHFHVCAQDYRGWRCQRMAVLPRTLKTRSFRLDGNNVAESSEVANQWLDIFNTKISPQDKLLVIINPHGGGQIAESLFTSQVAPLFGHAGIDYDTIVTTHAGHAEEIAMTTQLTDYTGIIITSGDGVMYEVMNGLMKRDDWHTACKHFRLGIIPAGTSNALYGAIASESGENVGTNMILNAAYIVSKNVSRPIDLTLVETSEWRRFSFINASWGFINDINEECDPLRWMGPGRVDLIALKKIMQRTVRNGKLEYLPFVDDEAVIEQSSDSSNSPFDRRWLPPCDQPVPSDWEVIEGGFFSFDAGTLTHITNEMHVFPNRPLGNGAINVLVLNGGVTRMQLFSLFRRIRIPGYDAATDPTFRVVRARAYRITPAEPVTAFSIDGEVLRTATPVTCMQGEIRRHSMHVFSRQGNHASQTCSVEVDR